MKRLISAIAVLFIAGTALHSHAKASQPPQFTGAPLASGIAAPFQIHTTALNMSTKSAIDMQNYTARWDPGATSGWHYHVGIVVVTLISGILTVYNKTVNGCVRSVYSKGQTFVERPYGVHVAINKGRTPVNVVTSEFILHGKQETVNVSRPLGCPNS